MDDGGGGRYVRAESRVCTVCAFAAPWCACLRVLARLVCHVETGRRSRLFLRLDRREVGVCSLLKTTFAQKFHDPPGIRPSDVMLKHTGYTLPGKEKTIWASTF